MPKEKSLRSSQIATDVSDGRRSLLDFRVDLALMVIVIAGQSDSPASELAGVAAEAVRHGASLAI